MFGHIQPEGITLVAEIYCGRGGGGKGHILLLRLLKPKLGTFLLKETETKVNTSKNEMKNKNKDDDYLDW